MTPTTVFDGSRLRALHINRGHGKLMVTFDFRAAGKSDFGQINPSTAFAKSGFDQLMIKTAANDWFINDETAAMEIVLGALAARYDRVHTLGYSMGGYGALRFAKTLQTDWLVAVSPQISIAPDTVPFDRRYQSDAADFDPDLGEIPKQPEQNGVIITDPFVRPDLRHAHMIQARCPQIDLLRLSFGGHPASQILRDVGRGGVIQRLAMGLVAAARVNHLHRNARLQSPHYLARLKKATQARWPHIAAFARTQADLLTQNAGKPGDSG